ncbi:transmembrane emp24 domain-containing protein p24delta3-like [Rhododendron vialii]|uniref:transmembrane emp24 domain-containing protein p24delta3-like n=1 Tax=Rhododendron vialii TaxID=182163 RepID=UPI00265EE6EB|nr:transmembrane emp24 domain-containing protein p24delta3-like [Rhododendron vialii]
MGKGAELSRGLFWAVTVLCLASDWMQVGEAIWLNLPGSSRTKCVSEEIQNNVVVLGDYVVISEDHTGHTLPTLTVKVTSPYGNNIHHQENVTHGQFAFTTHEAGNYLACFTVDGHYQGSGDVSVNLDWKTGIAAKDWDSVARKEKIDGVELELKKLEGAVEAIHENLLYLKSREAEMRTVSETTNTRVAWFSILSLGICIAVSVTQLWYLKRYFLKKKLI